MEIQVEYNGLEERQVKVKEQEAKGLRMLFDNFHPDWKSGDEPHGTMTFTDEPSPVAPLPEPVRDLGSEIDELAKRLEVEIDALKAKISALEAKIK